MTLALASPRRIEPTEFADELNVERERRSSNEISEQLDNERGA